MELLKKSAVTLVGGLLLLGGVVLLVLPGPGFLLIVAGLGVLATEYVWAQRLLKRAREKAQQAQDEAVKSPARTAATFLFAAGMIGLGVAMLVKRDLDVPFWSPLTGGVLAFSGLLVVATTYVSVRAANGQQTTHTGDGSVRLSGAAGASRPPRS